MYHTTPVSGPANLSIAIPNPLHPPSQRPLTVPLRAPFPSPLDGTRRRRAAEPHSGEDPLWREARRMSVGAQANWGHSERIRRGAHRETGRMQAPRGIPGARGGSLEKTKYCAYAPPTPPLHMHPDDGCYSLLEDREGY